MAERKRWTKQARTILDIIYTNEESLTASGIYDIAREAHPNISLGTVYRNLKRLDEAGLIRETTSNGVSVYFKHPFSSANLECEVGQVGNGIAYFRHMIELSKPVYCLQRVKQEMGPPADRYVQGV